MICTFCGSEFSQDRIDAEGVPLPTSNRNAKMIVRIAGVVHQFDHRNRQDRHKYADAQVVPRPAKAPQAVPAPTPAPSPEPVAEPMPVATSPAPQDIQVAGETRNVELSGLIKRR